MDPLSLSLLSLGVSSMAIRRYVRAAEASAEVVADTDGGALAKVGKLVIHAVAELSLRTGRGQQTRISDVARDLVALEGYEGLMVDTDVTLDTVFELEGDGIDDVFSILSRRRIDAVIYDADGIARCAVHQSRGPSDPPPLLVKLFAAAGLPLVTLPVHPDWREAMARVDAALGLGGQLATDGPDPAQRRRIADAA